jgi:hypothetical protein
MVRITSQITDEKIYSVTKSSETLPASTTQDLFVVTAGDPAMAAIEVIQIVGTVETVIQTQANATNIVWGPGDVPLCTTLDITGDTASPPVGYYLPEDQSGMLDTSSGFPSMLASPLMVMDGDIKLSCAATNTGATSWVIYYRKLQADATVVSA